MTKQTEEEVFTAGYKAGAAKRGDMSEADKEKNAKSAYQEFLKEKR